MRRIYTPLIVLIMMIILFTGCGEPVIEGIAPSKPALDSPIDSEQPTAVRLDWSTALNATSYQVYLGKTLGSMILIAQNITNTFYDVTGLDPSSLYYWKVVAKNNAGVTPSDTKVFSTGSLRAGNYLEIRDTATNTGSDFAITLFGNISNVRAIEIILTFDNSMIQMAPNGTLNDFELLNTLSDALAIIEINQNSVVISISKNSNFTLINESFLRIACDTKAITGVSQITIAEGSRIIDANFNTVTFNKSDKGFVFIR